MIVRMAEFATAFGRNVLLSSGNPNIQAVVPNDARVNCTFRNLMKSLLSTTLFCMMLMPEILSAADEPFISPREGFFSESTLLRPGKVDLLYKRRFDVDQYNAFLWTPLIKGGGGVFDSGAGNVTTYGGGFFRPLAPWPERGDLILGAQGVDNDFRSDYEVQGEYRFPFGLGIGGGALESLREADDIRFGKLTYRNTLRDWNYILAVLGQRTGFEERYGGPISGPATEFHTSPGGYAAVYNAQWMGVYGNDGEQWRGTLAYIAPESWKVVRPVVEAIWTDNSIGNRPGPKSLFVNGSLRFEGGFLSHAARLGRAMGPQGLEYGNPLGFIFPTWNRRLEVWEMGSLVDFRLERIEQVSDIVQERYEGYVFPFQVQPSRNRWLDAFFAGGAYSKTGRDETPSIIGGVLAEVGFVRVSVGVEYQSDPHETSVVVGLIDRF